MQAVSAAHLSVTSWNANALAHKTQQKRDLKRSLLTKLLASSSVLALQETHADEEALSILFPELSRDRWLFASAGASHAVGGIAVSIRRSSFSSSATADATVLVPGRVQLVRICDGNAQIYFLNMHVFDISEATRRKIFRHMAPISSLAISRPDRCIIFALGDVNSIAEQDFAYDVTSGEPILEDPASRRRNEEWLPLWGDWLELGATDPTHFNKQHSRLSRIDRMWTSMARASFLNMQVDSMTVGDPITARLRGTSDHVPVRICFSMAQAPQSQSRPIAQHVIKHKLFPSIARAYAAHIPLHLHQPPEQCRLLTVALRAAAARVRDLMTSLACPTPSHQYALMASMARAVARQHMPLARKLLRTAPFARKWIRIREGRIEFKQPASFEVKFADMREHVATQSSAAPLPKEQHAPSQRAQDLALQRQMRLWSREQPRAVLHAVVVGEDHITDTAGKSAALAKHWGDKFSAKPVDTQAMHSLAAFQPRFPELPPPARGTVRMALERAPSTAPGPDGVPATAWKALGDIAEKHIWDSLLFLMSGYGMGAAWSYALVVCPPKKTGPTDRLVSRRPAETRPLALKLAPAKFVSSVCNFTLRRPIAGWAAEQQRGFLPGKNLCDNIFLADTHARRLGFECSPAELPIALACDVEAAFPSANRRWLYHACLTAGAPPGMLSIILLTHVETWAVSLQGLSVRRDYLMSSGILQGDPMASLIFIILFNPVLLALLSGLSESDQLYACADDVLIVLSGFARILHVWKHLN